MPIGTLEPSYDCPAFPGALTDSCPDFGEQDTQELKSQFKVIDLSQDPVGRAKGFIIRNKEIENINLSAQGEYYQKMQQAEANVVILTIVIVLLLLVAVLYLTRKYRLKIVKR
jgi:hypothetical protein